MKQLTAPLLTYFVSLPYFATYFIFYILYHSRPKDITAFWVIY